MVLPSTQEERMWKVILRETQRLEIARRESRLTAPTGADLVAMLVKRQPDPMYGLQVPVVYVPFVASRVAEPPVDHVPIPLAAALPPELRDVYSSVDHLLLPEDRVPADMDRICSQF